MSASLQKGIAAAALVLLAVAGTTTAQAACSMSVSNNTATCSGTNAAGGACQAYAGMDEKGNQYMVCALVAGGKPTGLSGNPHVTWKVPAGEGRDGAKATAVKEEKKK